MSASSSPPCPAPLPGFDHSIFVSSKSTATWQSRRGGTAQDSKPSSWRSQHSSNPYYGYEETSKLCERFITSLFQCPSIPATTHRGNPKPPLAHFVAYALYRTRLPSTVLFCALLFLQRLKTRFPATRASSGHRLFIAAFIIASKVICDDTYSTPSWCIVAQQMFGLNEIIQMERELCAHLQWNLNVQGDELSEFSACIRFEHGSQATVATSLPPFEPMVGAVNAYTRREDTPGQFKPGQQFISRCDSQPQQAVHSHMSFSAPHDSPLTSPSTTVHSSLPGQFTSASSSLTTSPASYCKTPGSITVTRALCCFTRNTHVFHAFDIKPDTTPLNYIPCLSLSAGVGGEVSERIYGEGDVIIYTVAL